MEVPLGKKCRYAETGLNICETTSCRNSWNPLLLTYASTDPEIIKAHPGYQKICLQEAPLLNQKRHPLNSVPLKNPNFEKKKCFTPDVAFLLHQVLFFNKTKGPLDLRESSENSVDSNLASQLADSAKFQATVVEV